MKFFKPSIKTYLLAKPRCFNTDLYTFVCPDSLFSKLKLQSSSVNMILQVSCHDLFKSTVWFTYNWHCEYTNLGTSIYFHIFDKQI